MVPDLSWEGEDPCKVLQKPETPGTTVCPQGTHLETRQKPKCQKPVVPTFKNPHARKSESVKLKTACYWGGILIQKEGTPP